VEGSQKQERKSKQAHKDRIYKNAHKIKTESLNHDAVSLHVQQSSFLRTAVRFQSSPSTEPALFISFIHLFMSQESNFSCVIAVRSAKRALKRAV